MLRRKKLEKDLGFQESWASFGVPRKQDRMNYKISKECQEVLNQAKLTNGEQRFTQEQPMLTFQTQHKWATGNRTRSPPPTTAPRT